MPTRITDVAPSYADRIHAALERQFGPRPPSLREIAGQVGYSTEQIRKVLKGLPVVSEKLNRALCKYLRLDVAEMWELAQREKPPHPSASARWAPDGLDDAWQALTGGDQELVRKLIRRLARHST